MKALSAETPLKMQEERQHVDKCFARPMRLGWHDTWHLSAWPTIKIKNGVQSQILVTTMKQSAYTRERLVALSLKASPDLAH